VVPVAVRRVIDNGFSGENAAFVDQYFSVMMLVVAVLAVSSAGRYYFVTWIGERVTADLRDAVFAHLLKLSPSFYDEAQSGEVLARLTADTTQVKNVFGSTVSVALRNIVMLTGAITMLMVTSLKLSGMVLLVIPLIVLPMVIFGRKVRALSRRAQDTLAASAATAQESLYSVQAVQAFGQEPRIEQKFHVATEEAFVAAADRAKGPGAADGCDHLSGVRGDHRHLVVRRAGSIGWRHDAGHAWTVPALCSVRGGGHGIAVGSVGRTAAGSRGGGKAVGVAGHRTGHRRSRCRYRDARTGAWGGDL
jgi:ABC-type multidrug transport system fused ATPase/permease subunit